MMLSVSEIQEMKELMACKIEHINFKLLKKIHRIDDAFELVKISGELDKLVEATFATPAECYGKE